MGTALPPNLTPRPELHSRWMRLRWRSLMLHIFSPKLCLCLWRRRCTFLDWMNQRMTSKLIYTSCSCTRRVAILLCTVTQRRSPGCLQLWSSSCPLKKALKVMRLLSTKAEPRRRLIFHLKVLQSFFIRRSMQTESHWRSMSYWKSQTGSAYACLLFLSEARVAALICHWKSWYRRVTHPDYQRLRRLWNLGYKQCGETSR